MAKQFYPIDKNQIERIKFVMQEEHLKANAFAMSLGYDISSLSKTLNGKRPVPQSLIEAISKAYGISQEWLLNGEGEMKNELLPVKSDADGRPYYNVDFAAGFDVMFNDQTTVPDYYINFAPYNNCDCWVNAHGDSMAPTISSGDMVALKCIEDFRYLINGEIYAIVTTTGLRTIKRVRDNGETITLIPDNKEIAEQTIPKDILEHVFQIKCCLKQF